jgi:hypothetical protein
MKQQQKPFRPEEIEPSPSVKVRLDEAFKTKYHPRRELRLPYLQSVAAAVLLLVAGIGIGRWFDKPEATVERIVQQVRYVYRPVKEIQYIRVPDRSLTATVESRLRDSLALDDAANDLAVAEAGNASGSISMGDDSILQKMMVTIY